MNPEIMTIDEIRQTGLRAISRELGPVGLIRFLQQFELGEGDYSVERHAWLTEHTTLGELSADGEKEENDGTEPPLATMNLPVADSVAT
jgi:hypothetical protein